MRKLVIIKSSNDHSTQNPRVIEGVHHDSEMKNKSRKLMDDEFFKYVEKHGYHFTKKLADDVISRMSNSDKSKHMWTSDQVETALVPLGQFESTLAPVTIGDIAYLANYLYSTFYPYIVASESACIKGAIKIGKTEMKFPEYAFNHMISDYIGEGQTIDWSNFI